MKFGLTLTTEEGIILGQWRLNTDSAILKDMSLDNTDIFIGEEADGSIDYVVVPEVNLALKKG